MVIYIYYYRRQRQACAAAAFFPATRSDPRLAAVSTRPLLGVRFGLSLMIQPATHQPSDQLPLRNEEHSACD